MHSNYTGDTPYRVWLDLDNSLTRWKRPIFRIPFSQKSKSSVWNSNLFAGQAIAQLLLALHCHHTVDTQYRVWFDLDNSLTRWKRIFLKFWQIRNSRNSQNSVWKPIFFLGKLYQQIFALHSHYTGDTLYRVSLVLDKSLTRWKRTIIKIPFSQNSNSFVWKPNFFPMQAIQQLLFALHFHYTGDTPCRVWLDLDNSLTRSFLMKKNFFKILKNSQFAKLAKFRTKTQFFFLGKLYRNFFLLYTFITLVILHTKFGFIWTTPWPDEKELFLKFSKIPISRNSQNSVWKIIFFS